MSNTAPITDYKLNATNARSVGQPTGITVRGGYVGTFTRAEAVMSKRGTQGIEFDFKNNTGETAKYLTIWTVDFNGKELFGRKIIDALLTVMRIREIQVTSTQVMKFDQVAKIEKQVMAPCFPTLMNRPVGVVLVRAEYEASDGANKWKNEFICPFESGSNLLAGELLDKKDATGLERLIAALVDRPLKTGGAPRGQRQAATGNSSGFDDMDDDIPF